jgi:Rrf2 family protein
MRISEGVEWALHACTVLAAVPGAVEPRPGPPACPVLPAARLAEVLGVAGPYLAKHLQALSRAGIVESVAGKRGGYRLARPPQQITMLDVVLAIEGDEPAFVCTEIRQRGFIRLDDSAYVLPCGVARAMWAAEDAWRAELGRRTIADLVAAAAVGFTPEAVTQLVTWFQEVVR